MAENMMDKYRMGIESILNKGQKADEGWKFHIAKGQMVSSLDMQQLISLKSGIIICQQVHGKLQQAKKGNNNFILFSQGRNSLGPK